MKTRFKGIDGDILDKINHMRRDGASIQSIAKKFRIAPHIITQELFTYSTNEFEIKDTIYNMWKGGCSISDISNYYNIDKERIRNYLKRQKMKARDILVEYDNLVSQLREDGYILSEASEKAKSIQKEKYKNSQLS